LAGIADDRPQFPRYSDAEQILGTIFAVTY
jgi:hypothetical protein